MATQKPRILIADDEKNIRFTMTHALERSGYEIAAAVNGEGALKRLEAAEFDLLLLDLRMPGMDGMEVLREAAERYPGTRLVIVTAHGTVENAVEAVKLGAADFIQKPFPLRRSVTWWRRFSTGGIFARKRRMTTPRIWRSPSAASTSAVWPRRRPM